MIEYSRRYCEVDVQVLQAGYMIFRDALLDKYGLDCLTYPTMASLSDAYFNRQGCFEGVCEIAGVVQRFIANSSVGGRVMCAENKKATVEAQVSDSDGDCAENMKAMLRGDTQMSKCRDTADLRSLRVGRSRDQNF